MKDTAPGQTRAEALVVAKPYKGPESYQVEDAGLFFGRDDEAAQLVAKILSSRLTLLHAQSGAGKTSLLNARVIPNLEARGWSAFRILPQNDPTESVRLTTLHYILPSPETERFAVERAVRHLAESDEDLSIEELLTRYDELEPSDARRQLLAGAVDSAETVKIRASTAAFVAAQGLITPLFCRLLRSSIEIEAFAEHIAAIWQEEGEGASSRAPVTCETKVSELIKTLSDPAFIKAYLKLYDELNIPVPELSSFFEHLIATYGARRTRFALVLLLDQFEEMFTRFIDPGPLRPEQHAGLPDWRLRYEFFDQLERLYGTDALVIADEEELAVHDVIAKRTALPIRYVISMRDEYIAQLAPIRRFAATLDDNSYHLRLLEKKQAESATQQPATLFGYTYSAECYSKIIEQLTKEERFVEPAHLQLVCDKLWHERGRELAHAAQTIADGEQGIPSVDLATFEKFGGTKGILDSFFKDFLEDLEEDERSETLDMLEPLVTASGTRNIVERSQLVNVPFRDAGRRARLLDNLANRTIVRTERRLGGFFVEITHEFLIASILAAIQNPANRDSIYNRVRWALRSMMRLEMSAISGPYSRLLQGQEFNTLHKYRETVKWNDWSAEIMLRSAILLNSDKEVLSVWLAKYEKHSHPPDVQAALDEKAISGDGIAFLNLAELRAVNQARETLTLSPEQLSFVLRSMLALAIDAERDDIAYWTQRIKSHA